MILSKAYDEIMDRIVVNDDMRRRVLQNVEKEPANNVELRKILPYGREKKRDSAA